MGHYGLCRLSDEPVEVLLRHADPPAGILNDCRRPRDQVTHIWRSLSYSLSTCSSHINCFHGQEIKREC